MCWVLESHGQELDHRPRNREAEEVTCWLRAHTVQRAGV